MDLLELGCQLLSERLGLQIDEQTVASALSGLLGDGQGNMDLAGLAGRMAGSGDLADILGSWLGDGANAAISNDGVAGLFGDGSLAEFAARLGADRGSAVEGLAEVLPQIMDRASSGGTLHEGAGSLGSLLGAARSLLS